jgi:hypothetical protein
MKGRFTDQITSSDYIALKPIYTMRKLILCATFCGYAISSAQAQFASKILPGGAAFSNALATVVEHFRDNYHQIQGNMLPSDPDRNIYQSTVMLPGASQCVIYRFHSTEDSSASWQATLYNGDNFDAATKAYKQAFKQIKQTQFKIGIGKYGFEGSYLAPSENLRFTSSILRSTYNNDWYKNFIAEVDIVNSFEGWKVQLLLYSRKSDTESYD